MCLLLGPPGSGRSTLLKALAGQLMRDKDLKVEGTLRYNGLEPGRDFVVERAAAYIDQRDHHIAEMTVGECLAFAAGCLGPGFLRELHDTLQAAEAAAGLAGEQGDAELDQLLLSAKTHKSESVLVELYARLMGIEHVLDTVVGDDLLKGISGGQKRRLTTTELALGMSQVMLLDEISNGLDSATAYSILRSLRSFCHNTNATMMISLLQPGPELFDLFDDVTLMTAGRIVYSGPREGVLPFFSAQGLYCPHGLPVADFLQQVVSPADQQTFRAASQPGHLPSSPAPILLSSHQAPEVPTSPTAATTTTSENNNGLSNGHLNHAVAGAMSPAVSHTSKRSASSGGGGGVRSQWVGPDEMEEMFHAAPEGRALAAALAAPPYTHPLQGLVLHNNKYAQPMWHMFMSVFTREWLLFWRQGSFIKATFFQSIFGAFIVCTTFENLPHETFGDANRTLSVLFFSFMQQFMGGFNYAPVYVNRLMVVYRQRDHNFYTSFIYALSSVLMRLPEVFISSSVWSIMVCFSVGLAEDAGRFFIFWANLMAMGMCARAIFQFLGAVFRDTVMAQGIGAMLLMTLMNMSGFAIARPNIPGWWIWLYWINPMAWTLKSMAVSELTADKWHVAQSLARPGEPGYGDWLGLYVLQLRGLYTSWDWVWAGLGYTTGAVLILTVLQAIALQYIGPRKEVPPADAEALQESALQAAEAQHANGGAERGLPKALSLSSSMRMPNSPKSPQPDHMAIRIPSRLASHSHAAAAATVLPAPHAATGDSSGAAAVMSSADHTEAGVAAAVGAVGAEGEEGPALMFEPVVVTFCDLNYYVPKPGNKKEELQLLRDVSGCFLPGRLTALMGASGAGKTTLMDVLAGRKTEGRTEGRQLVNGHPKDMRTFGRISGYVEQFDVHVAQCSVEESVMFSARMRLPHAMQSPALLRAFCQEAMEAVELLPVAEQLVGSGPGSGLSLEARKRLTLAVELVANPSVLFLDEPTTGLDARAAALVMRVTRAIAEAGRTVVCTIHQPSADIVSMFDDLLLLKPGGRVIFNGPVGAGCSRLIDHFAAIDGIERPAPDMNPADWMLEITSPAQEQAMAIDFADFWGASSAAKEAAELCTSKSEPEPGSRPLEVASTFAVPLHVQARLLFGRAFTVHWRMPQYNVLRYMVTLFIAIVFGTLYWGRGKHRDTMLGVLDILGGLYSCVLYIGIFNCMVAMPKVMAERAVFYRERASRMYGVIPYAMAQGMSELPFVVVQAVVYSVIVYFTIQFQPTGAKFGWFLLFLLLSLLSFTQFGVAMGSLAPTGPVATALVGLCVMFWNFFCGFLVYRKDIPPWWIWAHYFNPAQWTLCGCISSQLGDVTDEYIEIDGGETETVAEYVHNTFGYQYSWRGWAALIMVGLIMMARGVAYLSLAKLNWSKR